MGVENGFARSPVANAPETNAGDERRREAAAESSWRCVRPRRSAAGEPLEGVGDVAVACALTRTWRPPLLTARGRRRGHPRGFEKEAEAEAAGGV